MDQGLELFSPIPEILEIEVSNILYDPGNIGKLCFLFSPSLDILEISNFSFLISKRFLKIFEISSVERGRREGPDAVQRGGGRDPPEGGGRQHQHLLRPLHLQPHRGQSARGQSPLLRIRDLI